MSQPCPQAFLQYGTQLGAELEVLANVGHRQFMHITAQSGKGAAIVACGEHEVAMLNRLYERMKDDPELIAFRQARATKVETDTVAILAPERN